MSLSLFRSLVAVFALVAPLAALTLGAAAPAFAQEGQTPAVRWNHAPEYRDDPADLYSFRPIFNPPYEVLPDPGMTPEFAFQKFTLLGNGSKKQATTQVGFTATVSILCDLLPPTGIKVIHLLRDLKTGNIIKTQEATVLDVHPGGVNLEQDSLGHYLISGKLGAQFTLEATFDLPPFVPANLGRYESRFIIGLL